MHRLLPLLLVLVACEAADTTDNGPDGADDTDPYAGLPQPTAPAPYSGGGACPEIVDGTNDGFRSAGANRSFVAHIPAKAKPGVLFLWHGNGDTKSNFDRYMDGDGLAKQLHVVVITPEKYAAPGDMYASMLDWGVPPRDPSYDDALFQDVLGCLAEQEQVDLRRVYTAGFSAGAMWSSWLVMNRADQLAAGVVFSGGSDGQVVLDVNPYVEPAWEIPLLMTEGGPQDNVMVDFSSMTASMSTKMRNNGSTVVVCHHTQGHTPPQGFTKWAWPFLRPHVYGSLPSPYADGQDPSGDLPLEGSVVCDWE